METSKKWKSIVKISQQGGGKKLNNGIFILLFTFSFFYLLSFTSFAEVSCSVNSDSTILTVSGSGELTSSDVSQYQYTVERVIIGSEITELKTVGYNGTFMN